MVRPLKEGLDYFPLDVDIDTNDKITMIEVNHSIEGFGVVVKLLCKIYKEGYFYEWTDRERLLFARRINVNINSVLAVVNDCIKEGLFNKMLFERYNILTSKRIQCTYLEAAKRRKQVIFIENYFLIDDVPTIVGQSKIAVLLEKEDGSRVNVNINPLPGGDNVNKSTQRKGKEIESKLKETKLKDKTKEFSLEIKNFRQRYSEKQQKVIDDYLDMIRHTRKSARLAPSIVYGMYQNWDKYPPICVEYGLITHTENPSYHTKEENYTMGIIRKTNAAEAAKKLAEPKKKLFEQGEESKRRQEQEFKPLYTGDDINDEDLL